MEGINIFIIFNFQNCKNCKTKGKKYEYKGGFWLYQGLLGLEHKKY